MSKTAKQAARLQAQKSACASVLRQLVADAEKAEAEKLKRGLPPLGPYSLAQIALALVLLPKHGALSTAGCDTVKTAAARLGPDWFAAVQTVAAEQWTNKIGNQVREVERGFEAGPYFQHAVSLIMEPGPVQTCREPIDTEKRFGDPCRRCGLDHSWWPAIVALRSARERRAEQVRDLGRVLSRYSLPVEQADEIIRRLEDIDHAPVIRLLQEGRAIATVEQARARRLTSFAKKLEDSDIASAVCRAGIDPALLRQRITDEITVLLARIKRGVQARKAFGIGSRGTLGDAWREMAVDILANVFCEAGIWPTVNWRRRHSRGDEGTLGDRRTPFAVFVEEVFTIVDRLCHFDEQAIQKDLKTWGGRSRL